MSDHGAGEDAPEPRTIEAAGGLLWRSTEAGGVEVALVHRPKYDDWSLPKGKLEPDEHPLLAALREVAEEAGSRAVPGRPLGQTRYAKAGVPKRVRYWSLRWASGDFAANDEVDELRWLPPGQAADALAPDRDLPLLQEFLRDPRPTRALVVVRHASAGDRDAWPGDDDARPLDDLGRAQAAGIAELLSAWEVARIHSADVLRCLDTVAPFAVRTGKTTSSEPLLSESGFAANPHGAADRAAELAHGLGPAVLCTQRAALPGLVEGLCRRLGHDLGELQPVEKAGLVVLHLTEADPLELVAVEQLPPPKAEPRSRGG